MGKTLYEWEYINVNGKKNASILTHIMFLGGVNIMITKCKVIINCSRRSIFSVETCTDKFTELYCKNYFTYAYTLSKWISQAVIQYITRVHSSKCDLMSISNSSRLVVDSKWKSLYVMVRWKHSETLANQTNILVSFLK